MKLVRYKDEDGFLQQSLLKNNMPSHQAHKGIPHNPPDLRQLDCESILQEINELLIKRGLLTLADINKNNNALSNAILVVMKPKIIELYKNNHPTGLHTNNLSISDNNKQNNNQGE